MSGASEVDRVVVVHGSADHETTDVLAASGLRVALQIGDTTVWAPSDGLAPAPAACSQVLEEPFPRLLLTVVEAAAALGVGRTTAYQLISDGQLEVIHVGRCARVPAAAVAELVDQLRQHRPSQESGTLASRGIAGASQLIAAIPRQAS